MNRTSICLQSQDTLLEDFTPGQKDYIIHTVYPILKKALVHYVTEAALNNQITERAHIPAAVQAH